MIWFWIILIGIVSIIWAVVSLVQESNKKEIEEASEEMTKGRVIFHSSGSASDSSSS